MFFNKKSNDAKNEAAAAPGKAAPTGRQPAPRAQAAPPLAPEEAKRRALVAKHFAAAFGETVAILMHAPEYKKFSLEDLEWLVVPAVTTGQFSVTTAQSKASGSTTPVGVILWASVSPEVDRRLSKSPGLPIKLAPQEWKSGDILWVIATVGDKRILQGMLNHLQQKDWAQKPVKILTQGKDGKPTVTLLGMKAA